MRLFAIELLFKNKLSKQIKKDKKGYKEGSKSSYLTEIFGLRNIFLTASPYLIIDIKEKYEELVYHVMKELDFKEQR